MREKIQKFGGAMLTPVLLFSFAGVVIGFGTLFTTSSIMGPLAYCNPDNPADCTLWYGIWNMILQGGWTVFNQLPLLFAIALPIGLAKKQNARCCMEALIGYLTFNYFVSTILAQWGGAFGVDFAQDPTVTQGTGLAMIASIKTLDMGMIGALIISGIIIYLHNHLFDTELPEWLGVFSGSTFVYAVTFFVMIPVAFLACWGWPHVQEGMRAFQQLLQHAGVWGIGVFAFLERLLIPFGLHHLLYAPFFFDNAVVQGGINANFAKMLPQMAASTETIREMAPWAQWTCNGWSKMFGAPGIALAFYFTAKPQRKQELLGLLIPVTLTAIICGITEPLEFTFLFIAPLLFVVHAALAGIMAMVMNLCGVTGIFTSGLIEMFANNLIPLMANHWREYIPIIIVGPIFTFIYFVVFRFLIIKMDLKTPGREDIDEEIHFASKKEYNEKKRNEKAAEKTKGGKASEVASNVSKASNVSGVSGDDQYMEKAKNCMRLLGGVNNIEEVTNCVTRLRVTVKDESKVAPDADFKKVGTSGTSRNGKAIQVIIGMKVPRVREDFDKLVEESWMDE